MEGIELLLVGQGGVFKSAIGDSCVVSVREVVRVGNVEDRGDGLVGRELDEGIVVEVRADIFDLGSLKDSLNV